MRVTRFTLLFILSGFWFAPRAQAQIEITDLDSVAIVKPKMHGKLYQFFDNGPKEIQYRNNDIVLTKDPSTPVLNGFGSYALTSLTGIGSSSGKEGYWKVSGVIQCNDTLPDWSVNLFCEGYLQKDRERSRDDDGSWSIETTKTKVYYWDKKASGLITESVDTVGFFKIIMGIPEDDLVKKWYGFIFPERSDNQNFSSKNNLHFNAYFSTGKDYEIKGKFRNKNFIIIQNGANRKVWIFIDDLMACMFQGDIDYSGVSKKNRIIPYILINKEIPACDRRDIFRLAIMSRFMNNYLSTH